jgi:hypothetical protein
MNTQQAMAITFNCMPERAIDWSIYNGLEISGVEILEMDGETFCERAERREDIQFYSLYASLIDGGVECIHYFPEGVTNPELPVKLTKALAETLGFGLVNLIP